MGRSDYTCLGQPPAVEHGPPRSPSALPAPPPPPLVAGSSAQWSRDGLHVIPTTGVTGIETKDGMDSKQKRARYASPIRLPPDTLRAASTEETPCKSTPANTMHSLGHKPERTGWGRGCGQGSLARGTTVASCGGFRRRTPRWTHDARPGPAAARRGCGPHWLGEMRTHSPSPRPLGMTTGTGRRLVELLGADKTSTSPVQKKRPLQLCPVIQTEQMRDRATPPSQTRKGGNFNRNLRATATHPMQRRVGWCGSTRREVHCTHWSEKFEKQTLTFQATEAGSTGPTRPDIPTQHSLCKV